MKMTNTPYQQYDYFTCPLEMAFKAKGSQMKKRYQNL